MNDDEDVLEFQNVVEMFDITPRTLRYYESIDLIFPKREGRKRLYTRREIGRLKLIMQGRRFGFKLEAIRQLLDLYDPQSGNHLQMRKAIEELEKHLAALETRKIELDEAIQDMKTIRSEIQLALESEQSGTKMA